MTPVSREVVIITPIIQDTRRFTTRGNGVHHILVTAADTMNFPLRTCLGVTLRHMVSEVIVVMTEIGLGIMNRVTVVGGTTDLPLTVQGET